MQRVLIVDDSETDRRLAKAILEKDGDLEVEFATDGKDALALLDRSLPDLVVTDLMMPEVSGLELVDAIISRFAQVPVILMASRGSEELVVEALERGASSYVPKRALAQDLLGTVQKVLAVSGERASKIRLLKNFSEIRCRFELENDYSLVPPLVIYTQDLVKQLGLCDDTHSMQVGIAFEEVLLNALYHGNLEISSDVREKHFSEYRALVMERSNAAPFKDRQIHVELLFTSDRVDLTVEDEGSGFDVSSIPPPDEIPDMNKVSGRGIFLMRTFMDEVVFGESGNRVTLVKHRQIQNV